MTLALQHFSTWWRAPRRAVVNLAFPARCGVCQSDEVALDGPVMLCEPCRSELPLTSWPVCPRCAAAVPEAAGAALPCSDCQRSRLHFDRTIALGSYEGSLRHWILRFKADRSGLAGRMLLEVAWERLQGELRGLAVDVVAAAPMSLLRRWRRGVNPPAGLAEQLARRLGLPAAPRMLNVGSKVVPQDELTRPGRFRNVRGSMAVRPGYSLQAAHVLLVDDILTTGATASEAARVLKRAGAQQVTIFVLGRTPSGKLLHA